MTCPPPTPHPHTHTHTPLTHKLSLSLSLYASIGTFDDAIPMSRRTKRRWRRTIRNVRRTIATVSLVIWALYSSSVVVVVEEEVEEERDVDSYAVWVEFRSDSKEKRDKERCGERERERG